MVCPCSEPPPISSTSAREHDVHRVLIALSYKERDESKAVVDLALRTDAQVKVLPRASELISRPLLQGLRDINLEDLMGREHAPVDVMGITGYLGGSSVLVSGAGGSIGSEIARQVARYGPRKLILLDRDDTLLCETAAELTEADLLLANIRDQERIRNAFEKYRPDVVFHAAAHKHVPILEDHPVEALETNLLATWWLASTAADYGCHRFVHISTDKAVNPCSVMGATKRAAELTVFTVGRECGLPCAVVRFGNVIGSRGSVVPTFLRQILDGGPVTLTDPDMKRYFMTIPEAVSLVLQAGSMADEGKIFLLDMGEPASILDMARQMIRLSGLRPDEDIEIKVTGLRRGERLVERLHDDNETIAPTSHPSIRSLTPKVDYEPAAALRRAPHARAFLCAGQWPRHDPATGTTAASQRCAVRVGSRRSAGLDATDRAVDAPASPRCRRDERLACCGREIDRELLSCR